MVWLHRARDSSPSALRRVGKTPSRTSSKAVGGWKFTGLEDALAVTSDSAFAGGTKQDHECASVISQKADNKADLKRVYFASQTINGHVYLNLAWIRMPQNTTSPSAHVAFDFNQGDTPCGGGSNGLVHRTAGDVLILYDFEGGSTDTPDDQAGAVDDHHRGRLRCGQPQPAVLGPGRHPPRR